MRQPILVIIGGANGSGKTTLAREFVRLENFTYLGADEIARELNEAAPEKVAFDAARLFSQRFGEFLERRESFIVESTLSGLSLRKWIERARGFDYEVEILFVYLSSPELCIERVAVRVAKGGHHVPEADIKRRFARANSNFWRVYKNLADVWSLFYNAGDTITQVANGNENGEVILDEARFEEWKKTATN